MPVSFEHALLNAFDFWRFFVASVVQSDLLTFWFSHFGPFLVVPKGDHLSVLGPLGRVAALCLNSLNRVFFLHRPSFYPMSDSSGFGIQMPAP